MSERLKFQGYHLPSEQLITEAETLGVDPKGLMRDFIVFDQMPSIRSLTVGDMADNLTGTSFVIPEMALSLGLEAGTKLDGGLVGSNLLRENLKGDHSHSELFIGHANSLLATAYEDLGIMEAAYADPAERFTGYLARIVMAPNNVVITGVGDVFVWVNGEHVIGDEKVVDQEKSRLVAQLTEGLQSQVETRRELLINMVTQFARTAMLGVALTERLSQRLADDLISQAEPDRQTMYRAVDDLVTPWQIRNLQNRSADSHPWAYGAVDGSVTPTEFISAVHLSAEDIESVVIATDGSKPAGDQGVRTVGDLEPVNAKFSERAVALLST